MIRDKNQKISLKKLVIDENRKQDDLHSFNNIQSSEEGQLILEKLQIDIDNLIKDNNRSERSNFATTIRKELRKYTNYENNFSIDDFLVNNIEEYYFKIKNINGNICIFLMI